MQPAPFSRRAKCAAHRPLDVEMRKSRGGGVAWRGASWAGRWGAPVGKGRKKQGVGGRGHKGEDPERGVSMPRAGAASGKQAAADRGTAQACVLGPAAGVCRRLEGDASDG
eukprot:scaffold1020_cov74-Phaeocystis_antarctica.AAC.5